MRIVLIAHDAKKADLLEWARFNQDRLAPHELVATRSTGEAIRKATGLDIALLKHGPEGGDAQVGARIAEGLVDLMVFLWDPLSPDRKSVV